MTASFVDPTLDRRGHQVETGLALLGAARCLEKLDDARSTDRSARAEEIFGGLGAHPFVPLSEGREL